MTYTNVKLALVAASAALVSACGGGGGGGGYGGSTQPPSAPPAAANAAPQITAIASQSGDEGQTMGPVSFTISDAETSVDALKVAVASANATLLPLDGIDLDGSGESRSLLLTPAADQSGTTQTTPTVTDAAGATATTQFDFVVKPLLRAQFAGWLRTTVLARSDADTPVGAVADDGAALTAVEDINRIRMEDDTATDKTAYADLIPPPPPPDEEEPT